jgi:hypothetical protein
MWNDEIMKCLVQFSAHGCSLFLSSKFNPLQTKRRRRRRNIERRGGRGTEIFTALKGPRQCPLVLVASAG